MSPDTARALTELCVCFEGGKLEKDMTQGKGLVQEGSSRQLGDTISFFPYSVETKHQLSSNNRTAFLSNQSNSGLFANFITLSLSLYHRLTKKGTIF